MRGRYVMAALAAMLLVLPFVPAQAKPALHRAANYATEGDCDGFPKVKLTTAPGLCMGLVASHLGFVRGIAVIGSDVYVVDMGGWHKGGGRVLRFKSSGRGAPEVLLEKLDEPNGIVAGPHGTLYVGVLGKIIAFDPQAESPSKTVRDVVVKLPDTGRHPLVAMIAAANGDLYINIGSGSDNCESEDGNPAVATQACSETQGARPRGVILRVHPRADSAVDAMAGDIVARGLRNSMGLSLLPNGKLVAAVNSRDAIDRADPSLSDEELPHDTLNWIEQGADYGWPYCYDSNLASPDYKGYDCSHKHLPTLLLPPHAAPLGLLYYTGNKLPGLKDHFILPYHGYRKSGHRIMALALNEHGMPQGEPEQIVGDWEFVEGSHPKGAPVAVAQLPDGSVLVTEDLNGTLLRLSADKNN